MNTIKFAPYNDFVTEQHDVENASAYEANVFGFNGKFYNPCNLNVFIQNKCQNDCEFCINKRNDRTDIDNELYFKNLEAILEGMKSVHLEATITGGEPTLNPARMVETIRMLRKFGVKERTVSTTGIGLMNLYENKPVLQHLIDNDYVHNISISRMDITDTENANVLKGKNITNEELARIAFYAKVNGVQLRTSTNIIENHIDSLEKILNFVDFQYKNNIDSCLFREVIAKDFISIAPFQEQIRNDKNFVFDKAIHGMFYDIIVYIYKSPETNQEYIVKCYQTNVIDKTVIGTLSYNQGKLRTGFNGEVLYGN
jgi:organic radical activating enzyme